MSLVCWRQRRKPAEFLKNRKIFEILALHIRGVRQIESVVGRCRRLSVKGCTPWTGARIWSSTTKPFIPWAPWGPQRHWLCEKAFTDQPCARFNFNCRCCPWTNQCTTICGCLMHAKLSFPSNANVVGMIWAVGASNLKPSWKTMRQGDRKTLQGYGSGPFVGMKGLLHSGAP